MPVIWPDFPPPVGALQEPYEGPPSAAMAAGYCPGCGGTGRVDRCVPEPDVYPCSTCGGDGLWPPLEWRPADVLFDPRDVGLLACLVVVVVAALYLAAQVLRWVI